MSNYNRLKTIYDKNSNQILPIRTGMLLEVHENVGEGDTKRNWKFKGLVIKVKKTNHPDGTFTIRGESAGMTIEKIYPLSFPNFNKLILLDDYKIRRSKLYYIREKVGKGAKFKSNIGKIKKGTDLLELVKKDIKEEPKKEEKAEEVKKEDTTTQNKTTTEEKK